MLSFTFHYVSINTGYPVKSTLCRYTLHSTMFLLIQLLRGHFGVISPDFTFHYVSINTLIARTIIWLYLIFTFHYVSINTLSQNVLLMHQHSLHSTMFLLIHKSGQKIYEGDIPLHSTMFLLIRRDGTKRAILTNNFTFHYVSINTGNGFCLNLPHIGLYIPLCFY